MFLSESFDVNDLPKSERNFEPLPNGWYTATITQAEVKKTKAGNGEYIKLRYDITGPTHQGRVVFGNLNIKNANPTAEKIGREQLGEIMRGIGLATVKDTDQLIGGQIGIKLEIKHDEKYGDGNEVRGFKSLSGSSAPPATKNPAMTPAPSPAKGAPAPAAPPWANKK